VKEKVVFDYTLESLLRVLGKPLSPRCVARLVELGVDPREKLLPAYPLHVYSQVLDFITGQLWPERPLEEGHFELGRAFMKAYRQTLMGKAVFSVTRVVGPHRALERMSRNFRSANNYTETRLRKVGPTTYELWFNYAARTGFFRGLLTESLETVGAKQIQVTVISHTDGGEATFQLKWKE
jgi:uncharacterized protein (TIGR02265 family)